MSNPDSERMELVPSFVHVPTEMLDQASQELAMLGLSPDFPARLQDLNTSLADSMGNSDRNFAGYKFILSPDTSRPIVETKQKYHFPFSIELDVSPLRRAHLAILPKFKDATLTSVRVDQLQSILSEVNNDFAVTVFEPFSDTVVFAKQLQELTEDNISNVHPSSQIIISSHNEPVGEFPSNCKISATKLNNTSHTNKIIPTVLIKGIEVEGPSGVVEASLGTIATLAQCWHARP